jgi:Gpi18-like mannosyltransferase
MAADASTELADSVPRSGKHRAAGPPSLSDRLPRPWLFPLGVFAATWLLILATWYGSNAILGPHQWTYHFLIDDTGFYRGIAQYGYTGDAAKPAFFPLFPLLIHLASYLTGGNYVVAGLITTIACGAAASVGVWAVASTVCGHRVADYAVVLFCVFPGAMTFAIMYSEPLAVALAAAALLALLNRKWLLAGIIGALGTAERPTLIVLAVVSGVVAVQAIWTRREWRALLAPVLTPIGILAYFAYIGHKYHNYRYWFWIEQKGWHQHFDWGAHTLSVLLWRNPGNALHRGFVVLITIMFVVAVAGIVLMIAARLPLPLVLFGILTILLTVTSSNGDARPRFVWTAFPIFIGAAAKLPRALYWPVVILSAAGFVLLVGGWRALFGLRLAP